VVGRVPVARCDDDVDPFREPLDRFRDLIAAGDGERTPRGEVVLEIDDQ
jgi:hypothetical protein